MLILGLSCTKDKLDWVVLDGADRTNAAKVVQRNASPPAGAERGEDLAWVRKEVMTMLDNHAVDCVVIKVAEKGGPGTGISLGRCEVEGVVQEALATRGVKTARATGASIRGAFGARTGAQLTEALGAVPVLVGVAATRRDPFIAALTAFPA